MRPAILEDGVDITPRWAFQEIWEYLLKISIIQQAAFKKNFGFVISAVLSDGLCG